jgi:hypothetical protein
MVRDGETTMRRWLAATTAVLTVTVLAGCGVDLPEGTDGDLTDGWSTITAPKAFAPVAGLCHESLDAEVSIESYKPRPCAALHVAETVAADVPEYGSDLEKAAYQDCAKRISTFVGAPWRTGRIGVNVVLPTQAGWTGGARWYRCDVTEININTSEPQARTGTMARGLAGNEPELLMGCFNPKIADDDVESMIAVDCTKPHKAEFAGLWKTPAGFAFKRFTANDKAVQKGCLSTIATFAKIPNDSDVQYRVGWIFYAPTPDEWDRGDRDVQCFLWKSGKSMTRSMKGAGTKGLPIRYA